MTPDRSTDLGFAAEHDAPIAYLARVREYYQALGYGAERGRAASGPRRTVGRRSQETSR